MSCQQNSVMLGHRFCSLPTEFGNARVRVRVNSTSRWHWQLACPYSANLRNPILINGDKAWSGDNMKVGTICCSSFSLDRLPTERALNIQTHRPCENFRTIDLFNVLTGSRTLKGEKLKENIWNIEILVCVNWLDWGDRIDVNWKEICNIKIYCCLIQSVD